MARAAEATEEGVVAAAVGFKLGDSTFRTGDRFGLYILYHHVKF